MLCIPIATSLWPPFFPQIRIGLSTGISFDKLASNIREQHMTRYLLRRSIWAGHATAVKASGHRSLTEKGPLLPFGEFDDPDGYAGKFPEGPFLVRKPRRRLCRFAVSLRTALKILLPLPCVVGGTGLGRSQPAAALLGDSDDDDRWGMSTGRYEPQARQESPCHWCAPRECLSMLPTLRIRPSKMPRPPHDPKCLLRAGGKAFEAVYTVMNEFNQILGSWFCRSKSLDEVHPKRRNQAYTTFCWLLLAAAGFQIAMCRRTRPAAHP